MKLKNGLVASAAVALALTLGWISSGFAQDGGQAGGVPGGFPDLVGGLKEIEGCLGVETAQTPGGMEVIFAWFESKEACARWYYSEVHQGAARAFFPDREPREPLADVPDNVGPVLAIASITMSSEREIDESSLPIKQISIELYTPLRGGLSIGGSFAPESMVVPRRKIIALEDE